MKVTPPLAVAPIAQEDDMRWNPNDDGTNQRHNKKEHVAHCATSHFWQPNARRNLDTWI